MRFNDFNWTFELPLGLIVVCLLAISNCLVVYKVRFSYRSACSMYDRMLNEYHVSLFYKCRLFRRLYLNLFNDGRFLSFFDLSMYRVQHEKNSCDHIPSLRKKDSSIEILFIQLIAFFFHFVYRRFLLNLVKH
jgi:hypothetical protein